MSRKIQSGRLASDASVRCSFAGIMQSVTPARMKRKDSKRIGRRKPPFSFVCIVLHYIVLQASVC